jgi:hypothetical protein
MQRSSQKLQARVIVAHVTVSDLPLRQVSATIKPQVANMLVDIQFQFSNLPSASTEKLSLSDALNRSSFGSLR